MRRCRLPAALAALACLSAGCWSYSYRPVEVVVADHTTGEPAAGVPVRAYYLGMMVLNLPEAADGITDGNGRVALTVADCGAHVEVGETRYYAEGALIREGGRLPYKPGPNGDRPAPPHAVAFAPVPPEPLMQRLRQRLAIVRAACTYPP